MRRDSLLSTNDQVNRAPKVLLKQKKWFLVKGTVRTSRALLLYQTPPKSNQAHHKSLSKQPKGLPQEKSKKFQVLIIYQHLINYQLVINYQMLINFTQRLVHLQKRFYSPKIKSQRRPSSDTPVKRSGRTSNSSSRQILINQLTLTSL